MALLPNAALPKPKPLDSATFANNAIQQAKGLSDPGVAARQTVDASNTAAPKAVSAFGSRLQDYSNWSKSLTQQTLAQRQAQKAAEATAASYRTAQARQSSTSSFQGAPQQLNDVELASYSKGSSPARQKIVDTALQYVKDGVRYAWSGGGANKRVSMGTGTGAGVVGVDCSGLVAYSYSQIGVNLPHFSGSQTALGHKTNIRNAMPGDIVGWNKGGHVAVYVGSGMIAEAPGPGKATRVRKLGANEAVYAVRLKLQGE